MSSPGRILASQPNGKPSYGPVTAEGKVRSAQNATTHGLSANTAHHVEQMAIDHQIDIMAPDIEAKYNHIDEPTRRALAFSHLADNGQRAHPADHQNEPSLENGHSPGERSESIQ